MPAPSKINPDLLRDDDRLLVLDDYRRYLVKLGNSNRKMKKQAEDAAKVIDCLRFIKVNPAFIRYAFNHREDNDPSIYTFLPRDKDNGVIRDFNGTSFHLNGYNSLETCLADLNSTVEQMEQGIFVVLAHNKLEEFTDRFRYNKDVGA